MHGKLIFAYLLVASASALWAQDSMLPPYPAEIREHSCVCKSVEVDIIDAPSKHVRREIRYEATASASYLRHHDIEFRGEWKMLLSVRPSMRASARDCVEWSEAVSKAIKRARK